MSSSGPPGSNNPPANLPARPDGPLPSFDRSFNHGASSQGYGGSSQAYSQQASGGSQFLPRSVTANAGNRGWQQAYSPSVSAPPAAASPGVSNYSAYPTPSYQAQPEYYQQQYSGYANNGYSDPSPAPSVPQIKNPFAPPTQGGSSHDPELEAQMQQWQSAYMSKDDPKNRSEGNPNNTPLGGRPNIGPALTNSEIAAAAPVGSKAAAVVQGKDGKVSTVVRSGGGKTWQDDSLLEWDPAHPRLFIGNLAGEVTDDSLHKAFSKYPSIVKAKVIRERRTSKSKGYGFVSFRTADDYLKAFKDMQGKYIGSHPILIKKSNTEIKAVDPNKNKHFNKNKKFGGGNKNRDATSANTGAGVKKNQNMRDGMKLLG